MKTQRSLILLALLLIVAAALSRLILYPNNFSPMIAIALFGGAVIRDRKYAVALPLFAMLISDLLFEVSGIADGFWGWGQLVGYGIMILISFVGRIMKKISVLKVVGYSVLSSLIFYILSNSSVFIFDNRIYHLYTNDLSGYINCMAAGLPFLQRAMLADLVFSGLLFSAYTFAVNYNRRSAAVVSN